MAKRRELAAHDCAILRHTEAAELQERLGHPERAANARTHAQQTWELRRRALQELRDWKGRPQPTRITQLPRRRGRIPAQAARTAKADVAPVVRYMASLALDANVATMTVVATKMPFIGRG